ncbi:MAG: NnrS family protein, partial [Pseudomonadota bacterium]|nr:NnrS family protein [Pseudomonadota bacterium]
MNPDRSLKRYWANLVSVPYRVLFLGGMTQLVLATGWWAYDLSARYGGLVPFEHPLVMPVALHAFLMIDGLMPFFMFGFLFTAGPRWLDVPAPPVRFYFPVALFMGLGILMVDAGMLVSVSLVMAGTLIYLLGWGGGLATTFYLMQANLNADRRHIAPIALALFMGWLGALAWLVWLKTGNPVWFRFVRIDGIWLFLLPVFLSVTHRMIPFFSRAVMDDSSPPWRPFWLLWLMLAGLVLHALFEWIHMPAFLWPDDLGLAIAGGVLCWRWKSVRSFRIKLLAMLHVGFGWFAVGMLFFAIQDWVDLKYPGQGIAFGWAPLHVLTMGFFLSILLAMVLRVSLGHGGRSLIASRWSWRVFVLYQLAMVLRVSADIVQGIPVGDFYFISALLAAGCFLFWFFMV